MNEEINIKGQFIVTIFRNDSTGYTIAKFRMHDKTEKVISVTGAFSVVNLDILYSLTGSYVNHPKYGMQFNTTTYEQIMPSDTDSLIRFFSSAIFSGIGKKTAEDIVNVLGEQAIDIIKENKDELLKVKSLNEKKRASIINGIHQHDDVDDSIVFLSSHGVSQRNIMKVEATYGERAISVIKKNPYQLVEDIDGIGFISADKLAKSLLFKDDDPNRIKAAVLACVLEICMNTGNSYVSYEQLKTATIRKLKFEEFDLDECIFYYIKKHILYNVDGRIYHSSQYEAECGIAKLLANFPYIEEDRIEEDLDKEIHKIEVKDNISYENLQRDAIKLFFKKDFMILTGGPGTGKTTIVKAILELYKKFYPNRGVILSAPTGRAAKRLSELSTGESSTIHRLLKWDLETNTFVKNEKDPIEADLLIVDEFSMVDQNLFYNLLRACKKVRKLLIIGDEDQLPSVSPGCVLKDLIETNEFPVIRLEKIYRQAEGSDVIALAHEIKDGFANSVEGSKDVVFFNATNYHICDMVKSIVTNAFNKGYTLNDIQVLAPMYNGVAGIDALNNTLQELCNPKEQYKKELRVGYRIFREMDKVLQLKNQIDDDIYNGDIGYIKEIIYANEDPSGRYHIIVDFDNNLVTYNSEQIINLTHAYCISIHKSQGSEYPIVIMPIISDNAYMLSRRLIYTGITRAKNSLVLLGNKEVMYNSIKKKESSQRLTTLIMKIHKEFS
ncbi:MAG: ATP-dependent RecD-like DNA helicase [Erysipelotrichaceae bacterium]